MVCKLVSYKRLFLWLSMVLSINLISSQSDIYWVGGNGDWDDIGMWYKDAAGLNPAGVIPNQNSIVHFTDESSTIPIWNVRLQPGSYHVHSILVETNDDFRIFFNGTDNNEVDLSVYGDIELLSTHRLEYASTFLLNNIWKFKGANNHDITSEGHNFSNIEIRNTAGTFNQLDDLTVSEQIRMFAGTWNSNSNNITTGKLLFKDDAPSSSPLTKTFNSGSSEIVCDEWESGFTYGSLIVTGNHIIRTSKFRGSPKQLNGPAFSFHEIHLLEFSDTPNGGSVIEHNNFECRSCIIEHIVIEDTGDTKLADKFTVTGEFKVVNRGSSILFNGGNSRDSEVTFNGLIVTPKVIDCDDPLTIFSSIHTDESEFIRNTGSLDLSDAVVNNIQTVSSGGAIFNIYKGVLQGASSGWNLTSAPDKINYYWRGTTGSVEDWDDPNNWTTASGSNGCIPTIKDNVFIDGNSKGDIRIPRPYNAVCRNLFWTNKDSLELTLDGTYNLESALTVTGHFDLHESAIVTPVSRHEIYFSSATDNYIETRGVQLPEVLFIGSAGEWTLQDDFHADQITFKAGTFNTNGSDVTTDTWNAFEEYPKHFDFGSSKITVNGVMDLAEFATRNVTVNPGSSLIECEVLNSVVTDLHDVQLNNTNTLTLGNNQYDFNSLILNGTGEVKTINDLTVNHLIFMANSSVLALDDTKTFVINEGIESMTSAGNPAVLKSKTAGIQVDIVKPLGNLCTVGNVEFIDINADFSFVFHAPDGIDGGNNTGIEYDDGGLSSTLYWISQTGGDWQVKSNWSRVSGGCPANKDPANSIHLEFNNNSFSTSPVTVSIQSPGAMANDIHFLNSENLKLDILGSSSFENLNIDGGFLNIIGAKELKIISNITIQSSGFLTTDLNNFTTGTVTANEGVFIVKNGSNVYINP